MFWGFKTYEIFSRQKISWFLHMDFEFMVGSQNRAMQPYSHLMPPQSHKKLTGLMVFSGGKQMGHMLKLNHKKNKEGNTMDSCCLFWHSKSNMHI